MLNYTEIILRIKKIMSDNELTAADFAKKVGVQRSSISHILSERNKPSLDFLAKVQFAFEDVEFDWLLLGNLKTPNNHPPTPTTLFQDLEPDDNQDNIEPTIILESDTNTTPEVKEIIYIYSDNSFKLITKKT